MNINVYRAREVRLWLTQIIIPAALLCYVCRNEIKDFIEEEVKPKMAKVNPVKK